MIAAPAASLRPSVLELDCDASDFLDFLPSLTETQIVVRAGSFAMFRKVRFGNFRPERNGFRRDECSGLALDPSRIRRVCFLADATPPPALEIAFDSGAFSFSILTGQGPRDRANLRAFVAESAGRELPYDAVRREGAAAWLDEGLSRPGRDVEGIWTNRLVFDRLSGAVAASLHSGFLQTTVRFLPRFIDRDGRVFRVSDAAGANVLHFHAAAAPEAFSSLLTAAVGREMCGNEAP